MHICSYVFLVSLSSILSAKVTRHYTIEHIKLLFLLTMLCLRQGCNSWGGHVPPKVWGRGTQYTLSPPLKSEGKREVLGLCGSGEGMKESTGANTQSDLTIWFDYSVLNNKPPISQFAIHNRSHSAPRKSSTFNFFEGAHPRPPAE